MDKDTDIFACLNHIDQAIDDYVNSMETAPRIIETNDNEKCIYCDEKAIYKITE